MNNKAGLDTTLCCTNKYLSDSYVFHRIGWINSEHKVISGWYLWVHSKENLSDWLQLNAGHVWGIWKDLKSCPTFNDEYKSGYCRTQKANQIQTLLAMKMEKEGISRISLIDGIGFIENLTTKTQVKIFNQYGEVYINSAGGCRLVQLSRKMNEKVFETITLKHLVFPTEIKDTINVVNWELGKHWYVVVNDINYGKYNSEKEAYRIKEEMEKQNAMAT